MSKSSKKCRIYKDGNMWCCVGPKFKNIEESASGFGVTPEESYADYLTDVTALKTAKKVAKAAKKVKAVSKKIVAGGRSSHIVKVAKRSYKNGLDELAALAACVLVNNNDFAEPLPCDEVSRTVKTVYAAKKKNAVSKKPKSEKGSRNTRIAKAIAKGFKNGANRAGVINLALIKNKKFNTPLPESEVTDMVRVEWERLNPPSE